MKHNITQVTSISQNKLENILLKFKKLTLASNEQKRLTLAKECLIKWRNISNLEPPGNLSRQDFWYLAQIFALNRHVDKNNRPIVFSFSKTITWYIDTYCIEPKYAITNSLFFQLLSFETNNIPLIMSREQIDTAINKHKKKLLLKLHFSLDNWDLKLIPYDLFLRLEQQLRSDIRNFYIDGYRRRTDGKLTGFIAGDPMHGGKSFIDSCWLEIPLQKTFPLLTIVPINYEYSNSS